MPTHFQQKENDPALSKLKRLGSIASIASPISQIASKLRRPSTAVPPSKITSAGLAERKTSIVSQPSQQNLIDSSKIPLKAIPAPRRVPEETKQIWTSNRAHTSLPKSRTTSNLRVLTRREPSYTVLPSSHSNSDLSKSRIPTSLGTLSANMLQTPKQNTNSLTLGMNGSALPRFSTQPNLGTANYSTPTRSDFRRRLTDVKETAASEPHPFTIPRKQVNGSGTKQLGTLRKPVEQENTIRRPTTTVAYSTWQQRPRRRTSPAPRKSIDEEYEEIYLSPKTIWNRRTQSPASPRRSYGREIAHHQLMMPLSPPLPRSPIDHKDPRSSPSFASARLTRQVSQAQLSAYWDGRYTSLNDRLLNEAMEAWSTSSKPFRSGKSRKEEETLSSLVDSLHGEAQAQHILDLLYAACTTEEALRSLRIWQTSFSRVRRMPNLASYTPARAFKDLAAAARADKRESMASQSAISNGRERVHDLCVDRHRASKLSEESAVGLETSTQKAVRGSNAEQAPGEGSGRKTSFIGRILTGGRRISGKASALGGAVLRAGDEEREMLIV